MDLAWRRKLPTGKALMEEAFRLGVISEPDRDIPLNDRDLQARVLAARAERRSAVLSFAQTVGIIGTLALTLTLAIWNRHEQSNQESAALMLKFSEGLNSGKGALVVKALDTYGNLDKVTVSDEALEDFLDEYELLAVAYRYHLINNDMAYDAFSYDLEKALADAKVRQFLLASRREEGDIYNGVLELARSFGIATGSFAGSPRATPTR